MGFLPHEQGMLKLSPPGHHSLCQPAADRSVQEPSQKWAERGDSWGQSPASRARLM